MVKKAIKISSSMMRVRFVLTRMISLLQQQATSYMFTLFFKLFFSCSKDPVSPPNGTTSPRENGIDKLVPKKEHIGPHRCNDQQSRILQLKISVLIQWLTDIDEFCSPRSGTSSNASTPSAKKMEEKPTTPISKSVTPTSGGSGSSVAGLSAMKPLVKPTLGTSWKLENGSYLDFLRENPP